LWYLERSFPGFWRKIDWPLFRTQLGYAVPLGFAGILVGLRSEAHNYVVAHHVSAAAFAVYAVGCSELPVVGMIREVVGTVLIRRISELHHGGSYRAILLLTIRGMKKLAIFYWPLYVFLMVMAREFTRLLYTKRYDASVPILWINLAMIPLTILVMDPVLRAFAEQRYFLVRLQTALLLVMAVALLTVTPLWGPRGAITVVVLCAAAEMACVMWRVATLLNMSVGDIKLAAGIFKLGLSALAGGAVAWVVRRALPAYHPAVVLAICGMAFLPVYAISAYLLGAIERAEVRDLALQGKRMLRLA
jgi:O-antigen/teichoic acid export membrane protein